MTLRLYNTMSRRVEEIVKRDDELKIYVCGKESTVHHKKMEQLSVAIEQFGVPGRAKLTSPTETEKKEMEDRHKHIFNYMLAEKTNAVQIVHIIDRILGTDVHLAGEGRPERVILDRKIDHLHENSHR